MIVFFIITVIISSFFRYGKKHFMFSLGMSVRPSSSFSVCPSSVEIILEHGSNRSAEPIDLKIG